MPFAMGRLAGLTETERPPAGVPRLRLGRRPREGYPAGRGGRPLSAAHPRVASMSSDSAGQGLSPVDRYADLVDDLILVAGVTPPSGGAGFGRSALKYQNKIFAMLVRGRLVVKLPAPRVAELVAAGEGDHFDANKGTPMKEWLSLSPDSEQDWLPLAREALRFAGADT